MKVIAIFESTSSLNWPWVRVLSGDGAEEEEEPPTPPPGLERRTLRGLGDLVYNIQIQLPESRDPAVYDALFRSLKTHLFFYE